MIYVIANGWAYEDKPYIIIRSIDRARNNITNGDTLNKDGSWYERAWYVDSEHFKTTREVIRVLRQCVPLKDLRGKTFICDDSFLAYNPSVKLDRVHL